MSALQSLFEDARKLVEAATRVLKNSALATLVSKVASLGNIGEEINSVLDTLADCFRAIAKGFQAIVEPLRQAAASLALVEILSPIAGALGGALAAFTDQLGALGAPVPSGGAFTSTLRDVTGVVEKLGPWAGQILPSPEDLERLAGAFGVDLVGALDNLRPRAAGGT